MSCDSCTHYEASYPLSVLSEVGGFRRNLRHGPGEHEFVDRSTGAKLTFGGLWDRDQSRRARRACLLEMPSVLHDASFRAWPTIDCATPTRQFGSACAAYVIQVYAKRRSTRAVALAKPCAAVNRHIAVRAAAPHRSQRCPRDARSRPPARQCERYWSSPRRAPTKASTGTGAASCVSSTPLKCRCGAASR